MRLGVVALGQSPRPDLVAPFRALLGPDAAIAEAGALDGLAPAAIADLAPRPDETPLITRLAGGQAVLIAEERILGLL